MNRKQLLVGAIICFAIAMFSIGALTHEIGKCYNWWPTEHQVVTFIPDDDTFRDGYGRDVY